MKNYRHIGMSSLLLVVLLFSSFMLSAANEILLTPGGSTRLDVTSNTFTRLQVSNAISEFKTFTVNTEKGVFFEMSATGYSKSNIVGAPQIPVLSKLIEVPAGATPVVKVISYEMQEYKLSDFGIHDNLIPVQQPQPKSKGPQPFTMNQQIYSKNAFYSEDLARVEVAGYLRGVRLANLILAPVEYNPVTNTIRVYNNMIVDVTFVGGNKALTDEIKAKTRSPYFNNVYSKVLNYQPVDNTLDTMSKFPVKYVIVSDPMFQAQLQPFVKWKTKRGFKVIEAYTNNPAVGTTFTSIKNYLQNLYTSATAADPAPTFILFVGDVAQIPAYNCGAHVSDMYYCEYSGDYLPEVYRGRFSASNAAQLQPQIDKTLMYEQYLMPDPSYLNEVVMIAGDDASHELTWGNGQINYGTTYYFNEAHNLLSHTYLQPEPGGANYSQNIINNISNGVGYANYTAHGSPSGWADPSFVISDISTLQNAGKYGLLVGNCCQTNTYDQNTFGEELLRAQNKGAIGYIGASNSTYWDEDYWWGVGVGTVSTNPTYETTGLGAYDRTFHDHGEPREEWSATSDQINFAGLLAVQESNSGQKQYYWEIYCLMGDPSSLIYFSEPSPLDVSYAPLLPLGATTFEIQTDPYAYVAITKDNVIHGVVESDMNGLALVNLIPFTNPGFASIVITKQNKQPYIDSVLVASPEGPYLVLDNYLIKDPSGNNNQIPEFGELLTMDMEIDNYGNANAVNATSVLSTNNYYITIPENTYTWPMIASNGSATATNAFQVQVNNGIPDMTEIPFTITTTADTSVFTENIQMLVYAPKLNNGNILFDDVAGGNGNGNPEPGETITFVMPVSNTGHSASSEVTSQLIAFNSPYITVNTPSQNLGVLQAGATTNATFSFTISNSAPVGSTYTLYITSSAGQYSALTSLTPQIGAQIEDYETANFLKYSWRMKGNKPWKISSSVKYEGAYSANSGTITNNQTSEMYIDGYVLSNDVISFYRKVSSQEGKDYLRFYIDGVELGAWSGSKDWEQVSFPVQAGSHRFSWTYEKDNTNMSGQDAAWIDYIKFPTFSQNSAGPLALNVMASPEVICPNGSSQLYVFASGGTGVYSYNWTPAASLSNSSVFNPIATPTQNTIYNVVVTSGLFTQSTDVMVTLDQVPNAPVVTAATDHLVSSVADGNQWYNSQGPIAGATSQTYYPTHTDTYYATVTNTAGCISEPSNQVAFGFLNTKPVGEVDFSVYPNPFSKSLTISYNNKTEGNVKVVLYNAIGNQVALIEEGYKAAGNYKTTFEGSSLATGIYYCKLFNGNNVKVVKVIKK